MNITQKIVSKAPEDSSCRQWGTYTGTARVGNRVHTFPRRLLLTATQGCHGERILVGLSG